MTLHFEALIRTADPWAALDIDWVFKSMSMTSTFFQSQHGRSDKPGRHSPWKAKPCPLIQLAMPRYLCIIVIMHMYVHDLTVCAFVLRWFNNPLSGFQFSFSGGGTLHAAVPREAYPWALFVPRLRFHTTMVPCDVSLNNRHATVPPMWFWTTAQPFGNQFNLTLTIVLKTPSMNPWSTCLSHVVINIIMVTYFDVDPNQWNPTSPRALACLSDSFDEHMSAVRFCDQEDFDPLALKGVMNQPHGRNWVMVWVLFYFRFGHVCAGNLHPLEIKNRPLRFVDSITFLFSNGRCWHVHGTYSALMKRLGIRNNNIITCQHIANQPIQVENAWLMFLNMLRDCATILE